MSEGLEPESPQMTKAVRRFQLHLDSDGRVLKIQQG